MQTLTGVTVRNYVIQDLIGAGGYGQVYKAYQPEVAREVAIKVILPDYTNREEFIARFDSEAHLIARLEHPHIVPLFDYWRDPDGAFLVMRWIRGGSLRRLLKEQGALPLAQVRRIVEHIGDALAVAHQAGVVHRDLKPENVLLDERGNAYLSDFGIAKDTKADTSITQTDSVVGTPAYLAPEQLRGEPVTPQADIYNLGIILYEMLAGEHPFARASGLSVINSHLNDSLPLLRSKRPDLPPGVDSIVGRATEKDAAARYPNVETMVEDFQRTLTNALSPLSATGTPSAQTPSEIEVEVLDVRTAKLDVEIDAPHTPSSPEARNRHRMLQNVRTFWIKGVLENSLHGALVLDLGMKQNVGSVVHPWDTLIRMTDSDTQTLPPGTPMIEVFDRLNGKLLILGNPGGGKTTVLLELARDLLDRAARDSEHPIPVVFNLSSWAEKRFPLVEWLIVELNSKYQVPKAVARQWVKEDALLLLLDGLDEVESRYRDACVGAINQYREEHGFVDVVVCSRTADYDALTAKVNLNGAIILQPLNDSQVDAYLASLGKGLTSLRRVLPADPVLQELVRSPLMLNITTLAYHGATPGSLQEVPETRRNHIFAAYVERMFARRAGEKPYTREQTSHYLKWLAQHMIEHGQSVFQIEALQPDWLTPDQFKRYRTIVHTLFVVVFAALFGVTALVNILLIQAAPNWRQPEIGTVPFMILSIVIAALTGGFVGFENAKGLPLRPIARWRQQFAPILLSVLLAFSFSFVVLNSFPAGITLTAIIGGAFGYYIIIQIGMAERRKTGNNPSHIVAAEKIAWNRHKVKPIFLLLSPFLAVVSMFTLRTAFPKPDLAESTFIAAVVIFTLICAGMIVAVVGIVTGNVETHTRPNQGIWQSFIFANRFAAALGGVHLLLVLPISMVASTELALPIALYNLSFLTPSVWLIRGGGPLYHFLLRRVLERDGMIPQNMAHFLDFCAGLILLRKVGGSYIYIHRALLEYFAALPESE